jgi:hypothetical protein
MEGEGRWNSIQANRNEGQENIPIRATRKKADLRGKNSPFQDHQRGLQSHTFSENVLSFFQGMSERLPQSIQREPSVHARMELNICHNPDDSVTVSEVLGHDTITVCSR